MVSKFEGSSNRSSVERTDFQKSFQHFFLNHKLWNFLVIQLETPMDSELSELL